MVDSNSPAQNSSAQKIEKLNKQLTGAVQQADQHKKENEKLKRMVEVLVLDNGTLRQNEARMAKLNKKLDNMIKSKGLLTKDEQSSLILGAVSQKNNNRAQSKTEELEKKLKELNFEKERSEFEKQGRIFSLTFERDQLVEKCNTIKMMDSELRKKNEVLTELTEQLLKESEPEIQLGNEIEDTSCTICTEEMKLKKCSTCRRRFHESCIERWLGDHDTCPTCRATWNHNL